jgi:hypothetical protein
VTPGKRTGPVVAGICAAALAASLACAFPASAHVAAAARPASDSIRGPGWEFSWPDAVAVASGRVWVANSGDSVTEINAATGALVRVISARRYRLNGLLGIAATGNKIWTATNPDGGDNQTVTEINAATGALIRTGSVSSLPGIAFAMTANRYGAWVVTNDTGGKGGGTPDGVVAEFSAATGALVRTISPPILANSNGGGGIIAGGGHIWVTGTSFYTGAGWLAEFSATTGALVRQIVAGG